VLYEQPRGRSLAREGMVFACPAMILTPQGLMLGAGTILVPVEGMRKLQSLQGQEQQILALLSAAYGTAVAPSVLGNIERAGKSWSEGDDFTAHIHLAHTGLRALDDFPRAAHRPCMAKGALDHGASPRAVFEALRLDARYIDALEKRYNPEQPRVPAGHPDGGQWTSGDWSSAGTASSHQAASEQQVLSDATPDNPWKPGAQHAANEPPPPSFSHNQGPRYENSTASDAGDRSIQQAQLVPLLETPPVEIFSRVPTTPLDELPQGPAGGAGAGARFPRALNEQNQQQNPNCYLCGRPTTREPGSDQYNGDHIVPRAQGCNNDPTNIGTTCRTCNLLKGNKTPQQYVPRFYFDPLRADPKTS
jgi:HNH endonuclease